MGEVGVQIKQRQQRLQNNNHARYILDFTVPLLGGHLSLYVLHWSEHLVTSPMTLGPADHQ